MCVFEVKYMQRDRIVLGVLAGTKKFLSLKKKFSFL